MLPRVLPRDTVPQTHTYCIQYTGGQTYPTDHLLSVYPLRKILPEDHKDTTTVTSSIIRHSNVILGGGGRGGGGHPQFFPTFASGSVRSLVTERPAGPVMFWAKIQIQYHRNAKGCQIHQPLPFCGSRHLWCLAPKGAYPVHGSNQYHSSAQNIYQRPVYIPMPKILPVKPLHSYIHRRR